ncbi:MAG: hypothetical protein JNM25_05840 [Planctomycetes bacterium]|nr:hypothetical protein [Planctomycetota bacterium]
MSNRLEDAELRALHEAGAAAVAAEVGNATLHARLMRSTVRDDLRRVFDRLRRAAQERHLPAFRRCASRGTRHGRCRRGPA